MAAPVRIENEAFSDVRIEILASLAGYNRYEALGRLAHLWSWCTERGLHEVSEATITTIIGPAGVQHMLDADLAERTSTGIRVRGTGGRIEWLIDRRARTQAAGKARAARAQRDEAGRLTSARPAHDQHPSSTCWTDAGDTDQHDASGASSTHPASASPLSLSLSLSMSREEEESGAPSATADSPSGRKRSRKPKRAPTDPTPEERASVNLVLAKLGGHTGTKYSGAENHVRLIVGRLREGLTEWDLRKVIGYCAIQLEWASKPKMRPYLRPETLFGPESIARYLDAARAWHAALPPAAPPPHEPPNLSEGAA